MTLKRLLAMLFALALVAAACGDSDDGESTDTTAASDSDDGGTDTTAASDDGSDTTAAAAEIKMGRGVTEDTIKVGLNADLTGIFAPLVTQIVDAQQVYWDKVNAEGGIAGRQIEAVVLDNAYDVPTHLENWDQFKDEVAIISQSTGSPHTSATAEEAAEENMVIIPLSWYSGWADPAFGEKIYETYTNYCFESMNGISWMQQHVQAETGEDLRLAIISFPGEYGQDGAQGAKLAAEGLGIEIVYDGEAAVVPGSDQTPVISEVVGSGANGVWATINPSTLAEIMGGTVAQGSTAVWSGNSPTYNFQLLATELGPALDEFYFQSTYTTPWGQSDAAGSAEMVEAVSTALPDNPTSDVYVWGWTEAMMVDQILRLAAEKGDLSPEGIVAAANEVEVDFQGLAPDQTWAGDPNDYIVRESYIYDISLADFNLIPLGEGIGSTGSIPIEGFAPFVADITAGYDFTGPCFLPQG